MSRAVDFGRDAARPYRGPSSYNIRDQMVETWVFIGTGARIASRSMIGKYD